MSDTFGMMLSNMQEALFAKMNEMQTKNETMISDFQKKEECFAQLDKYKTDSQELQTEYNEMKEKYVKVVEENNKMSKILSNSSLKGQVLERNFSEWLQNFCLQVNNGNSTYIFEADETSKKHGHGDFHLTIKVRATMHVLFKLIIDTKFEKSPNWSLDVPKIIRDCNNQCGDAYLLVFPNDCLKKYKGILDFDSEAGIDFQRHIKDFGNVDPKMGFACEIDYVQHGIMQLMLKKQQKPTVSSENYEFGLSLISMIEFCQKIVKPILSSFCDKNDLVTWNKLGHVAQQKMNRIAATNPDSDSPFFKIIKEKMKNIAVVHENASHSSCFNSEIDGNNLNPKKRPREI
tara:strand:- start:412 stop:1449 length:1038 start_codon:yes stop_codon:yes gene_type:complete